MKKTVFALIAIATLGLASCQKTDTPAQPELTPAEQVAGNYSGDMTITVAGNPSEPTTQTIEIVENGDSAIDLTLTDFSFMGMPFGTISLTDCALTKNEADGTISVTAQKTISLETAGDCDVDLNGKFADGKATLDLGISPAIFPLEVSVHFEGTRAEVAE